MRITHYNRLVHIKELLIKRGDVDAVDALPACYSAVGFNDGLKELAADGKVLLVGLGELYGEAYSGRGSSRNE